MIGGPGATGILPSVSGVGGGKPDRLPSSDPSRSNYCGWDWNDALASCDEDDHWCPSGADEDCPGGKLCFAGTDCKYEADLFPTMSPTDEPSYPPTPSPTDYNNVENTRFCGEGWEDVHNTCRIGSHCPSGDNADCPGTQTCYGWIIGCNIVDFNEYFNDNGKEIFGKEHWLMPEEGLDADDVGDDNKLSEPQQAPAEILQSLSIPTPAKPTAPLQPTVELYVPTYTNPPTPPRPTTQRPVTGSPTKFDPNRFDAGNHIFCGKTWTDASERCSQETFCSSGALHTCANATDYCWVGVTNCNAAEWETPPQTTNSPTTNAPTTKPPTRKPTPPPVAPAPAPSSSSSSVSSPSGGTKVVVSSFCATDYSQVISSCATLSSCTDSKCAKGLMCFRGAKCLLPEAGPTPKPVAPPPAATNAPISNAPVSGAPVSYAPISNAPMSNAPITSLPTPNPTIYTLTEEELADRFTNMNRYCAASLSQVYELCSTSLYTCNNGEMCGIGTYCFSNIVCPDPEAATKAPVTAKPSRGPSKEPTSRPSSQAMGVLDLGLISQANNINNAVERPQNYCGSSENQMKATCATTAPTCNDNDGPCPSGTFCFGNHVCDTNENEATSAATSTRVPTIKPSPTPVDPSSDNLVSNNAGVSQNYCSISEDILKSTCAWAQTCNDGEVCPTGSFCFGNFLCPTSSNAQQSSVATMPIQTASPISSKPTKPIIPIDLNKPDNQNLATKQNYCGKLSDDLSEVCAWAPTCNDGDGPCPSDTFCFPNVVCKPAVDQAVPAEGDNAEEEVLESDEPPESVQPPEENNNSGDTSNIADPACDELCLQPIDHSDCDFVLGLNIEFRPCTSNLERTQIGEFCLGTNRCGTDRGLYNCPNDQDIYLRLGSEVCLESGLQDGIGVLAPLRGEDGANDDKSDQSGENQLLNDEAAVEASTNSSSTTNNPENVTYPWDDWESKEGNLENGSFNNNGETDTYELTGWWREENILNAGGGTAGGQRKYLTTLAFMFIAFPFS